jgi:predicted amidohydrolase
MKKQFTLGGCRLRITQDISQNLKELKKFIDWAAENNIDIVGTPECALSGYMWAPADHNQDQLNLLEQALKEIKDYSKEKSVDVVLGTAWFDKSGQWANQIKVIVDGEYQYEYSKSILLEQEFIYTRGTSPTIFDYKGFTISALICNDFWSNPQLWPGASGNILNVLYDRKVEIIFQAVYSPKFAGPDNVFYRYHQTQIEMANLFNHWITVTSDTTTNVDGTDYHGPAASPCGICDNNVDWVRGDDTQISYFKKTITKNVEEQSE